MTGHAALETAGASFYISIASDSESGMGVSDWWSLSHPAHAPVAKESGNVSLVFLESVVGGGL